MIVRGTKHTAQLVDVLPIVEVDIRITEMELEAEMDLSVSGATRDLFERIVFERIDTAKSAKTVWEPRDLSAGPIVLVFDPFVLVLDGGAVWVAELIRD